MELEKSRLQRILVHIACNGLFLSFVLYPMLKGIHLSLYRFRGRHISFVGFKHYINLFQNDIFLKSAWNTVFITFVALPIVVVFSIFVAYVIYEKMLLSDHFLEEFSTSRQYLR